MRTAPRRGATRREAVVLLGVAFVLCCLVVTGVVRVREAAARMTCRNNLKQLGLGVHTYYDANQKLPPLTDQGTDAPTGDGLPSVFATLGPYLEAGHRMYHPGESPAANYNAHTSVPLPFKWKDGADAVQHGGDANQVWRAFLDPADWTAHGLRDVAVVLPDGSTGYYATGSYAANGLLPWGAKAIPKFPAAWPAELILFAERPQSCRTAGGEVVHNLWGVGFYSPQMPAFTALTPTEPPGLWSTGQVAPLLSQPEAPSSGEFLVRVGRVDSPPQPPDFPTPLQFLSGGEPCDPRLPGTPHRAGMNAAMKDGSVRVFARSTEPWVFWAACAPPPSP